MSLTIQSGGSVTIQGGSGGGGAISAVGSVTQAAAVYTSSATYVDANSTALKVTLSTGTRALVSLGANMGAASVAGGGTNAMSFRISGATTRSASNDTAVFFSPSTAGFAASVSGTYIVEGLTAGSNTFTLQIKSDNGSRWYHNFQLTVQALA